jgi:hypothetical protein
LQSPPHWQFVSDNLPRSTGSAVDALAEAAETTHTTLTSIITTLLAIDEMLPLQERLSPPTSAHKKHYPRLHGLLSDKAHELNVLFRTGKSVDRVDRPLAPPPPPKIQTDPDDDGGPSSSRDPDTSVWARRRMSSMSAFTIQPPTSPSLTRSNTFSHSRGLSSPHLQLRTVLPSPSSPPATDPYASSGAYYPIPPKAATGISLASPQGSSSIAALPASPSAPSRPSSGLWGRESSSALGFYPEDSGRESNAISTSKWRHSGSWAGFWIGGKRNSFEERREGAEDRLRRMLGGSESGGGKGKSVVV